MGWKDFTRDEKKAILKSAAYVANADGNINYSENQYLNILVLAMEGDNALVKDAMDMWKMNMTRVIRNMSQDKKDIAKKVTDEVSTRPLGFIEELEATLSVVSKSVVSLVFYVVLFCFLTFLELFVLTIKMGDTKCDYDLIVENQLRLKKTLMEQTSQSLMIKRVA